MAGGILLCLNEVMLSYFGVVTLQGVLRLLKWQGGTSNIFWYEMSFFGGEGVK